MRNLIRRAPFTLGFVSLWLTGYTILVLGGSGHLIQDLWALGAMGIEANQPLEFLRLFSHLFIHGSFIHLLCNALLFGYLGVLLEADHQPAIVNTFLVCGVVSSFVYWFSPLIIWTGASGGIYALAALYLTRHSELKTAARPELPLIPPVGIYVGLIADSALQWLAGAHWVVLCHLAGFALGLVCSQKHVRNLLSSPVTLKVSLVLVIAALLYASAHRLSWTNATANQMTAALLSRDQLSPAVVNQLVWYLAQPASNAQSTLLRVAYQRQQALLARDDSRGSFTDTFATLLETQGDASEALRYRLQVLEKRLSRRYARTIAESLYGLGQNTFSNGATTVAIRCTGRDSLALDLWIQDGIQDSWSLNVVKLLNTTGATFATVTTRFGLTCSDEPEADSAFSATSATPE